MAQYNSQIQLWYIYEFMNLGYNVNYQLIHAPLLWYQMYQEADCSMQYDLKSGPDE